MFRCRLAEADRRTHDLRLPQDWALVVRRDAERAAALAEPVRRLAQLLAVPPGGDYHRLSASEHAWIFTELVVPMYLGDITGQDAPVALYVMGVQGAGKSHTAYTLLRALRAPPDPDRGWHLQGPAPRLPAVVGGGAADDLGTDSGGLQALAADGRGLRTGAPR
ncbi:hypothetical protein AB8O64_36195 (plasmid) [Streptomyces sp. QH1-20]|uniref:hypothetical protein n=1 Tax=Streptomyces sp. QH1-20 TaxID=3240934 RepID=UPI0035198041